MEIVGSALMDSALLKHDGAHFNLSIQEMKIGRSLSLIYLVSSRPDMATW